MNNSIIHNLPRLYERDIDVLLQEELIFNEAVREVIRRQLSIEAPLEIVRCGLSVVDETGETDLVAQFVSGNTEGVILIENKINAVFQTTQPQRYRDRVLALVGQGIKSHCILIAPLSYLQVNSLDIRHFDGAVSYEEIALAMTSDKTARAAHRAELVLRAVNQARKSYVLIPREAASNFWKRVFEIAQNGFPELKMKTPGEKGSYSYWVSFKADLPPNIVIDWKVTQSVVDLSFWENASHRPSRASDLSDLPTNAQIEDVSKGTLAVRIPVSTAPANWTETGAEQIEEALRAGYALLNFYNNKRGSF
jgi:hypothetical protein